MHEPAASSRSRRCWRPARHDACGRPGVMRGKRRRRTRRRSTRAESRAVPAAWSCRTWTAPTASPVLCRDASLAEDLSRTHSCGLFRGFQGFRGGDPRAWLFAIVRRATPLAQRRSEPHEDAERALEKRPPMRRPRKSYLVQQAEAQIGARRHRGLRSPSRDLVLRELEELSYRENRRRHRRADRHGDVAAGAGREMLLAALPRRSSGHGPLAPTRKPCARPAGRRTARPTPRPASPTLKTCPACAQASRVCRR